MIFIDNRCRELASKGGFNAHISYSITPIDQTSVDRVYGYDWTISGDR
jgi:hypothetical protein